VVAHNLTSLLKRLDKGARGELCGQMFALVSSQFRFFLRLRHKKRGDIEVIRADLQFDRNVPIESQVSDFLFGFNRRLQGEIGY
jgi:hypothetical protein